MPNVSGFDIVAFFEPANQVRVDRLAKDLARAAEENAMAIVVRDGKIVGVCLGCILNDKLHIMQLKANDRAALRRMIDEYHKRFPGKEMTAVRRGKRVTYNTKELLRRLYG